MKNVRIWVRRVHLTLALTLGLFVSVLGLSGSVLVFGDEIDAWLRPSLSTVSATAGAERAPLDEAVAAAQAAVPDTQSYYLHFPTDDRASYMFWQYTEDGEFVKVYVDPYNATVLGHTHEHAGFVGFMHDLHIHLLLGDDGITVVGLLGLGLLMLLGTGLYLWWPTLRQLRAALTVKWSASWRRRVYDLHRAGGAWTAALVGFAAITGVCLAFYSYTAPALIGTLGGELPPDTVALEEPADGPGQWQQVLDAAFAEFPEADPRWFYFPPSPDRSAAVQMRQPSNVNPHGNSFVHVHPHRDEVISTYDWREARPGKTVVDLLYPLHVGHFGPTLLVRTVMAVAGCVPALLLGTGTWLWWQRRRGTAAAAARAERVALSEAQAAG